MPVVRSLRGRSEQQLIAFGEEESHIRLEVMRKNRGDRIDVHLKRDEKKGIAVNGIPVKKMGELFGTPLRCHILAGGFVPH